MQHQVKLRKKAIPELTAWCLELENKMTGMIDDGKREMIDLFREVDHVIHSDIAHLSNREKERVSFACQK